MNQVKNLQKLKELSYFDKTTLSQFIAGSERAVYENINRWLKQGILIQLKKGFYVTNDYFLSSKEKGIYREFIANKLREPSYLSLEYVLQKHGVLTEAIYAYTSVTLKSKRTYTNKLGNFGYRNIKKDLFSGFTIKTHNEFEIKEASVAKALFDYLYFKLWRSHNISLELLMSYRLNLDPLSNKDFKELAYYCQLAGWKKFKNLTKLLKKAYDH